MATSSPSPAATEQRLLAAIVFTDIAGFSARVQSQESATLKLVERDFVVMRAVAAALSGTVLKSTGDGLLILFTSAVNAVEWALQIQRQFAAQAKELPATEVLRHRVGVHLGDVFVTPNDVMGDGVNIAARLQAQAPAGGICISQSVYDVVKNKMKLDVIRLEPRKLKNIAEAIQMYHLLLEPRPVVAATPSTHPLPSAATQKAPPRRPKLAIFAALATIGLIAAWLLHAHFEHEKDLNQSRDTQAVLGALLSNKSATGPAAKIPPAAPVAASATDELDFAQRALDRPAGSAATPEDERLLREAKERIAPVVAWTLTELRRYSADRPLRVRPLERSSVKSLNLFSDADGRFHLAEGGATRARAWKDFRPAQQGAIILGVLRGAPAQPPEEVTRGAGAFAYVHALPDMALELIEERRANPPPR